jgi:hypothetical protein
MQQHLPLVLTGGAFLLVCFRVLAIARYNPSTFRAILATAGPAQVILGTFVGLLPILVLAVVVLYAPVVYRWTYHGPVRRFTREQRMFGGTLWLLVTLVVLVFSLLVWPWPQVVMFLVLFLISGFYFDWIIRRVEASSGRELTFRPWHLVAAVVFSLLGVFAVDPDPWLPAEKIELRGQDPLVGYVLSESNDELDVLEHGDRLVIRVDRADVESREICRPEIDYGLLPELRLFNPDTNYDRCPD